MRDDVFEPIICLQVFCSASAFHLYGIFDVDDAVVAYDF